MRTRFVLGTSLALSSLTFSVVGCGTGFDEVLRQTLAAAGRTSLDTLITDFANALFADAEQADDDSSSDGSDADSDAVDDATEDGSDDAAEDVDGVGDSDDGGTGAVAAGDTLYTSNGCGSCHCADASGDCALSAPALVGTDTTILNDSLIGEAVHPVKLELTADELLQMEAYLGSL